MLELSVTCKKGLSNTYVKFQKIQGDHCGKNFDFDYLLVADETYIGVAEPTFVGSYKL